jgi:tryptophanyl-tRNA synthetase
MIRKHTRHKSRIRRLNSLSQHTELAWIFNTITPVSWLERLPTYKEQREKTKTNALGLLAYPTLMAADILAYRPTIVPVGDDQKFHIDVTNEIAKRFNHRFGETFQTVKAHTTEGTRILSLQNPPQKMSKTGDDPLYLTDTPDEIREKIKKAVTDSGDAIRYDPDTKPAVSNLLMLFHLFTEEDIATLEDRYATRGYATLKKDLADAAVASLAPFQKKHEQLTQETLDAVKRTMGLS